LLKELCEASSTITDAVSKQVLGTSHAPHPRIGVCVNCFLIMLCKGDLQACTNFVSAGDLIAAVLKHVTPPGTDFSANSGTSTAISAAATAFFAEIGAQIRPGLSDLLLPTLFSQIRSSSSSGWNTDAAVDVVKHVSERVEDRLAHLFVSAFTDEVADNLKQLPLHAVKSAVRACVIVQARIRDPVNSLPFARLFAVVVDCTLLPAWSITAAELQPIVNKFASRLKSLTRSLEVLHK